MIPKFFSNLYFFLIDLIWGAKPDTAITNGINLYKKHIFYNAGSWTLVMAFGLVLIFYYVFNGQKFEFLKGQGLSERKHWFGVLLLVAGVSAWLAYFVSVRLGASPEPYLRYFIMVNALVGSLWFFLLSFIPTKLVKRYSNAKTTPF